MVINLLILASGPIWWDIPSLFFCCKTFPLSSQIVYVIPTGFQTLAVGRSPGLKGKFPILEKSRKLREQIQYVIGIKL